MSNGMKHKRRDAAGHVGAAVDEIVLDFANPDFPTTLTFNHLNRNICSLQIRHFDCTGIAGNWLFQHSPDKSGTNAMDMVEGALTAAAGANTVAQVVKGSKTTEFVALTLPATLPASGKAIITITANAYI